MNEENDKIVNIPVEDILPNRFQPRLAFDEKELNELSNSIVKYGVIQPIVLRQMGDKYEIIAGERRFKATVLAGLKTIPAIINNTDDNTSAEIALLENLQRKNLTVIEEAQSFKKLLNKGFTQEDIANKLGISQSSIANKIRLLNLPKKIQDALLYNKISERHARSLLSLDNSEMQLDLLDRIINEKLTVRQTEAEISKLLNNGQEEDDIPEEIKKYIVDTSFEKKESNNNEINSNKPDILSIDVPKFDETIDTENKIINPFQSNFKEGIQKIEENLKNTDEDFYDQIINNNIRNDKFNFVDLGDDKEEKINDVNVENDEKKSLPTVISEIRSFVNVLGKNYKISTNELDFPDKYQIIIDIKKE